MSRRTAPSTTRRPAIPPSPTSSSVPPGALSRELIVVGPAGSALAAAAAEAGAPWAAEGFPDRAYEADGSLRSRRLADAMVLDPAIAAERAVRMVRDGTVVAVDGSVVQVAPDTLCLHGDAPGAPERAAGTPARARRGGYRGPGAWRLNGRPGPRRVSPAWPAW